MSSMMSLYLLTVRGTLKPTSLDAARKLHNEKAGAPASIAAANSLGDVSHMVYVPLDPSSAEVGACMFMDIWNSAEGINQFFSNPQVQQQADELFSQREAIVWQTAEGFYTYHLPAPTARPERFTAVVRGMLGSREEGMRVHNGLVEKFINKARSRGHISHDAYLRVPTNGTSGSVEFFAVDVWMDAAGMGQHYQDPEILSGFGGMFAAPPAASIWAHPTGEWKEW